MIINTSLNAAFNVAESISYGNATNVAVQNNETAAISWGNGTGAGLNDLHWEKKGVVLAAAGTTTFTLSALVDDLGRAVPILHAHTFGIHCTTRTSGDWLTIGNNATRAWAAPFGATGTAVVHDLLVLGSGPEGYAIVASTSDIIKIVNSGANAITFNIYVAGRSV